MVAVVNGTGRRSDRKVKSKLCLRRSKQKPGTKAAGAISQLVAAVDERRLDMSCSPEGFPATGRRRELGSRLEKLDARRRRDEELRCLGLCLGVCVFRKRRKGVGFKSRNITQVIPF